MPVKNINMDVFLAQLGAGAEQAQEEMAGREEEGKSEKGGRREGLGLPRVSSGQHRVPGGEAGPGQPGHPDGGTEKDPEAEGASRSSALGEGSFFPPFIPPFILQVLLERRLLELRDQARRQEELLHRRVSSDEQREVLALLCKVHELEVENTEIQSHALLKDSVIRQKNFVVQRYEQHRRLCDEIIQQQRQFIDGELTRAAPNVSEK